MKNRSKYWETMVDILDKEFPKGECKERGRALVMISYIEMMLQGVEFEDGEPKEKNEPKGGNLINSPCCDAEIIIHDSESNFAHIDHFSCEKCGKDLNLKPLEVRKNW